MIEGLKVTLLGAELMKLCNQRAEHHKQRAEIYAKQREDMASQQIDGLSHSNGDPKRLMADRETEHRNSESEMRFIADHIELNETYMLDRQDLHKLGICKQAY